MNQSIAKLKESGHDYHAEINVKKVKTLEKQLKSNIEILKKVIEPSPKLAFFRDWNIFLKEQKDVISEFELNSAAAEHHHPEEYHLLTEARKIFEASYPAMKKLMAMQISKKPSSQYEIQSLQKESYRLEQEIKQAKEEVIEILKNIRKNLSSPKPNTKKPNLRL